MILSVLYLFGSTVYVWFVGMVFFYCESLRGLYEDCGLWVGFWVVDGDCRENFSLY